MWPDHFFPFFFGVAEKRVWSGLQSLLVLAPSTVVVGVNDGNTICYYFIVTHTISIVPYKLVSLKFIACENGGEVTILKWKTLYDHEAATSFSH